MAAPCRTSVQVLGLDFGPSYLKILRSPLYGTNLTRPKAEGCQGKPCNRARRAHEDQVAQADIRACSEPTSGKIVAKACKEGLSDTKGAHCSALQKHLLLDLLACEPFI